MNALTSFFDRFILQNSMSVTVAVVLIAAVRCLMHKTHIPKKAICLLWIIPFLRLTVPVLPESSFSVLPGMPQAGLMRQIAAPREEADVAYTREGESTSLAKEHDTAKTHASSVNENSRKYADVRRMLPQMWLAGVAFAISYAMLHMVRLKRLLRGAVRKAGETQIFYADGIRTAFVSGILRPRIYLPSNVDAASEHHILRHERMHIRHGDHVTKPLAYMVLCTYWFHPAVWAAYLMFSRDIEYACDEAVIAGKPDGYRRQYADTLLMCAKEMHCASRMMPPAFSVGGPKQRIAHIMRYRKAGRALSVAAMLLTLVLAALLLTNPKTARADDTPQGRQEPYRTEAFIISEPVRQMTEEYIEENPTHDWYITDGFCILFECPDADRPQYRAELDNVPQEMIAQAKTAYLAQEITDSTYPLRPPQTPSSAFLFRMQLTYMYPGAGIFLQGEVLSFVEEERDGLRILKVTMRETPVLPDAHYLFVIDEANGYLLQAGGWIPMEEIEEIADHCRITVTGELLDPADNGSARALREGVRIYCVNNGQG